MTKRAIIYAAVGSGNPDSIDRQISGCQEVAEALTGERVPEEDIYVDSPRRKRVEFHRMLKNLDGVDYLLCEAQDMLFGWKEASFYVQLVYDANAALEAANCEIVECLMSPLRKRSWRP